MLTKGSLWFFLSMSAICFGGTDSSRHLGLCYTLEGLAEFKNRISLWDVVYFFCPEDFPVPQVTTGEIYVSDNNIDNNEHPVSHNLLTYSPNPANFLTCSSFLRKLSHPRPH
ncbi:hypothetical protein Y032_0003g1221 [Ancylostoma ceylanicum]|uniref:Ephrin RBD domain-containing protein n=1 Tax=Ancylostoma ceylanicum TaxID=53326 RepID=A0A016VVX4_9BILA|nr:hypothetical protein Y032_0003g1221 [Ancylostoma ceylanicum]